MLCEICKRTEATVHITKKARTGGKVKRSFCSSCAEELGLGPSGTGDSLILFPWEEQGEESFSVAGKIENILQDRVTLRVVRSTHFSPGTLLAINVNYVPERMRKVGGDFSFNFPFDKLSAVLIERGE